MGSCLCAEAGESRLVGGVDGGVLLAGSTTAGTATGAATGSTTSAIATTAAGATAGTAARATTGRAVLRLLDVAVLELDELLLLALALALSLATGALEENLFLGAGVEGNEVLPLVLLDTLVGDTDVGGSGETLGLLLLLDLGLVIIEQNLDGLRLGLLNLDLGSGALGSELGLSGLLAGLLVLELIGALVRAPSLVGGLLRATAKRVKLGCWVYFIRRKD